MSFFAIQHHNCYNFNIQNVHVLFSLFQYRIISYPFVLSNFREWKNTRAVHASLESRL